MSLITIDKDKCLKDARCSKDCPVGIISMSDDSYPEIKRHREEFCIECGHCVAICREGALSHKQVPLEACPVIERDLVINQRQAIQFLRSRRSIRQFKKDPLPKKVVEELIHTARYAPTGSNEQSVEWRVFTDREAHREIIQRTVDWIDHVLADGSADKFRPYMPRVAKAWKKGFDSVLRNAPVLLVASTSNQINMGMVDLSIALSYLELAAVPMGIGTCWAGIVQGALLDWEPLKEYMGLPESHIHHYPMMVGYAKTAYYRLPERKVPAIFWT